MLVKVTRMMTNAFAACRNTYRLKRVVMALLLGSPCDPMAAGSQTSPRGQPAAWCRSILISLKWPNFGVLGGLHSVLSGTRKGILNSLKLLQTCISERSQGTFARFAS